MNRKKSRFLKRFAACAMALSIAIASSGCGQTETTRGKIVFIVRGLGAQYWDFMEQGVNEAAEELRYDVTFEGPPTEAEIDVQIKMIDQAIADKVDAVVISPLDTNEVADALTRVNQAGIPIIMVNNEAASRFSTQNRAICIATNTDSGGAIAARQAKDLMNGSGKVKVLSHTTDAEVVNGRYDGFINELAADPEKYADIEVLEDIAYCNGPEANGDPRAYAKQEALKAIKEYGGELKLIYATNETSALGACDAVKEAGVSNVTQVIGFDASDAQVEFLGQDILDGIITQNPYNMGYLGVRYANLVIQGESVPDNIDTGVTFINNQNLSEDHIQLLLNPVKYYKEHNGVAPEVADGDAAQ